MNIYTAHYTDNNTKRKITLAVVAEDYLKGLDIARKLTETHPYRFDDLNFKSKAPKKVLNNLSNL